MAKLPFKLTPKRVAVLALLLMPLTASAAPQSDLRVLLDQLYADRKTDPVIVTDAVLKFIPVGTPEGQVLQVMRNAGIQRYGRVEVSNADERCPLAKFDPTHPGARAACFAKSDYYLEFSGGSGFGLIWADYWVEIGLRSGGVDHVFGKMQTDCFCP